MGERITKNIKYIFESIADLLYADEGKCLICRGFRAEDEYICKDCMDTITFCSKPYEISSGDQKFTYISSAYYNGAIKELIIRLKYKSDFKAGEAIAQFMKDSLLKIKQDFDMITCVPTGKAALKRRGYNQSRVLAINLSKLTGIPFMDMLVKLRETEDQIGLGGTERWHNLEGSFEVKNNSAIKCSHIILVDDVITTGATAFYCASKLAGCGSNESMKDITILTAAKSKV
jgi:competence protein ComFC